MTTIGIIILVGLVYLKGMGFYSQSKSPVIGLIDDKLSLCGDRPNCVSTSNTDEGHAIESIKTELSLKEIINIFKSEKLELISQNSNYAHFTFESPIMGYIDDIEILKEEDQIKIRSASRVGRSDLGANRKRVERLREALTK